MCEEDIRDDYSCGSCGWTGSCHECDEDNDEEGDLFSRCPKCWSERVGTITDEDFAIGNALHGKTWHGRIVY